MLVPTINGIAVLMPCHDDIELGQPIRHYHVDPRFTKLYDQQIIREGPLEYLDLEPEFDMFVETTNCNWLSLLWQRVVKGKGDGIHCPHKGYKLEGCAICPLHGLPNPIPNVEDLVVTAEDRDGRVLGSVKVVDCTWPTLHVNIAKDGTVEAVKCYGRAIYKKSMFLIAGDYLKLTIVSQGN